MPRALSTAAAALLVLTGCAADERLEPEDPQATEASEGAGCDEAGTEFETIKHETFDAPWALEFLPDAGALLITERTGVLKLRDQGSGAVQEISGTPEVVDAGQGGLHDVMAAPTFDEDRTVYLSWVRSAESGTQGVVGAAKLDTDHASLENLEVIWEQDSASGDGHFSLRMLILDDLLYVTSGDRQELELAQDRGTNLGTIVRLTLDGDPAPGNPFEDDGEEAAEFWSTGHRNPLGIATDSQDNLWSSEMGPQGGDELNLIREGANYGWPEASMGTHYSGEEIPTIPRMTTSRHRKHPGCRRSRRAT